MFRPITWLLNHKLTVVLLLVIGYLLFQSSGFGIMPHALNSTVSRGGYSMAESAPSLGIASDSYQAKSVALPMMANEVPPTSNPDRLVIKDTNLSMVVTDVAKTVASIESIAKDNGGYMVNSNLTIPEGAATGTISIRVPEVNRTTVLSAIKQAGVKVTSEYVSGTDVTDQYVDTQARLDTLNATKTKFEEIMQTAIKVQDILEVQREIINLQSQIDNLKGQQLYLDQSAKLSLISINLSTDELALPYTPDKGWRPVVIFKEAVRSLVSFLRQLGTLAIWIAVFSPIWLTLLIIIWLVKRKQRTAKV
jgi:hypothetical protein